MAFKCVSCILSNVCGCGGSFIQGLVCNDGFVVNDLCTTVYECTVDLVSEHKYGQKLVAKISA